MVSQIFSSIKAAGGEARFVGGCVRDAIMLGTDVLQSKDIDISVNLPVDTVASILQNIGAKVITKYATNITILQGRVYEITSTRKDTNCDGRHATMVFTPHFEEDAMRRDFTINALFMDESGKIYDYFGGINDAKNGVVRFIGNPNHRIVEDYLRIWRFFRFSCLYAKNIDPEGLAACIDNRAGLVGLSKERCTAEFIKLLTGHKYLEYLKLLSQNDILSNVNLAPPLLPLPPRLRFFYATNVTPNSAFIYTKEQTRFMVLYNNFKAQVESELELKFLSYKTDLHIFSDISTLLYATNTIPFACKYINYTPPPLPFSIADIAKTTPPALIKRKIDDTIKEFLLSTN
jgi:tRNA nucleotidyltransferase/poly(A) polymerase